MGFRGVDFAHLARFNSATSSEILEFYETFVDNKILAELAEPPSKFIAPSGIRCQRAQWFRLRGTEPDRAGTADRVLNFTAEIGTACHRIIQRNFKEALKEDWISVTSYFSTTYIGHTYVLKEVDDGLETQVEFQDIPIRFACDGIIRWKGKLYLLEIKSSDFGSFDELTDPKSQHIDQIKCYSSLLKLEGVIVVYIDRQYGGLKFYEKTFTPADHEQVERTIQHIIDMTEANIAPDRLPTGDPWCTPSRCKFYKTCKQWG